MHLFGRARWMHVICKNIIIASDSIRKDAPYKGELLGSENMRLTEN